MQIPVSAPQDKLLNRWYFRNTYLAAIFLLGALPLVFLSIGLMTTEINLIENLSGKDTSPIAIGKLESEVYINEQGELISLCTINTLDEWHVCGYRVNLTKDLKTPIDFTSFDNMVVRLTISTPSSTDSVRLQTTSFNTSYSVVDDIDTQKYQGVTLDAATGSVEYTVPLGNFEVESWWLYRYNIGMQNSLPELDKVTAFAMVHNGFKTTGDYQISLSSMILQGKLISTLTAFYFLFFATLIIIVLSTLRHRQLIRSQIELDNLTGALNRIGMTTFLKRQLAHQRERKQYGVIFIDIDDFKNVNDSHGHEFGDEILYLFCQHTNKLINNFVVDNTVSKLVRISGDEFVILLETSNQDQVKALCHDLCESFKAPIDTSLGKFTINISVGGSQGLPNKKDISHLIKYADDAMYIAKQNGKNQWRFYDDELALQSNVSDPLVKILLEKIDNTNETFLFHPLCHIKTKSLNKILVDLSPLMTKSIERLIASIAQKSKATETQELIIEHLVAKLNSILLANKNWLKQSEVGLIVKVLPNFVDRESIYSKLIQELKKILAIHQKLVISLPTNKSENQTDAPLHAINAIKHAGFDVGLYGLSGSVASTDMFTELDMKTLIIDSSFLKNHLSDITGQDLIYHLFGFLKAFDATLIVDSGMNKLNEINYIMSTHADYMSGYLMEASFCLSDFEESISKDSAKAQSTI